MDNKREHKTRILQQQIRMYAQCPLDPDFPMFKDCYSRLYQIASKVRKRGFAKYPYAAIAKQILADMNEYENLNIPQEMHIANISSKQAWCIALGYLTFANTKVPFYNNHFPAYTAETKRATEEAVEYINEHKDDYIKAYHADNEDEQADTQETDPYAPFKRAEKDVFNLADLCNE